MFTGLVESLGKISRIVPRGGDMRLWVEMGSLNTAGIALGDSIAVSGVCLTVVEKSAGRCAFDVSVESLKRSSLAMLGVGASVNLEPALTLSKPLGGHLVSGHVDGVGSVVSLVESARSWRITVQASEDLIKYLAPKGSITLDGISLTINEVSGQQFTVNVIPHTFEMTTIKQWSVGREINLEVDLIARYVEALLRGGVQPGSHQDAGVRQSGLSLDLLRQSGFLNT